MGYAFISYSSKNKDSADAIRNLFIKNNIDTWMAPNDIPSGSKYAEVISKAIKNCACFVLLLTNNSQNSLWVSKEVERAINYKKTIIPIQLEHVLLNDEFEMYISTDQILPIKKIDETINEIQNLIITVKTHTKSATHETQSKASNLAENIETDDVIDGKYRIIRKISSRGDYAFFLATHEKSNTPYIIKVIYKRSEIYRLFVQNLSANILHLNLSHPVIPRIMDIVDTDKYLLLVMEYIDGVSLSEVLKKNGAQSEEIVLRWAIQLCEAVNYLHSQNPAIFHNNLQPSNILLKPDGNIVLLDFGTFKKIEKSTQNSICLGTAYYTAPETFTTNQIDKRTDIYALGVTLYSLITGNDLSAPPYVIYPIRKINPTLSKGFEYIITKCMDQKPENRYQNMQELLTDLYNINKITYKLNNPTLLKKLISLFKKND